jgi:hypothetical protein
MRIQVLAASVLTLTLVGARAAHGQHDRSSHSSRRHDDDSRSWLERCRDDKWGDDDRAHFCEERTMGWHAQSGLALTVDASPNGGVSVTGWDRDSVAVTVRIQANGDDDAAARDIARQIRVTNDNGVLRADGPGMRRHSNWSVSFEIMAPRRTDLSLDTENGPLDVDNVMGRIRLSAQNGPLSLQDVAGDVQARAQNGPLHVALTGTRWEGTGLDAETQNGPLVLEVPDGYNAQLETGTINGPMEIGFPIMVQGRIGMGSRRRITTTLGSGGAPIRAVTTNGPAVIRKS